MTQLVTGLPWKHDFEFLPPTKKLVMVGCACSSSDDEMGLRQEGSVSSKSVRDHVSKHRVERNRKIHSVSLQPPHTYANTRTCMCVQTCKFVCQHTKSQYCRKERQKSIMGVIFVSHSYTKWRKWHNFFFFIWAHNPTPPSELFLFPNPLNGFYFHLGTLRCLCPSRLFINTFPLRNVFVSSVCVIHSIMLVSRNLWPVPLVQGIKVISIFSLL